MSKEAKRPKSEMAAATTAKKATQAKAASKAAGKKTAKKSVSDEVKGPISSPVLKRATRSAGGEAATGAKVSKKKAVATPSRPKVDLPHQTSTKSSEVIEVWIRTRAYELWEQRGRVPGYETEDWLRAEKEIAKAITKAAEPLKKTRATVRGNVK